MLCRLVQGSLGGPDLLLTSIVVVMGMCLPVSFGGLPWSSLLNVLGMEPEHSHPESSQVLILPVPYEATTSYGGGTGCGPAAILEASRYIELYDQELDSEPYEVGIATLPYLELSGAGPEAAIRELRTAYDALLAAYPDRFIITLGGEHSISSAPILSWADRLAAEGRRLTVLQLDAHSDLRPEYEGSPYSHASVMHRVHEAGIEIVSAGIRSLTREERELIALADDLHLFLADDIHSDETWIDEVLSLLGEDVYLTFDVDVFDPSLVPSTGTPEPGGLGWCRHRRLLRAGKSRRRHPVRGVRPCAVL